MSSIMLSVTIWNDLPLGHLSDSILESRRYKVSSAIKVSPGKRYKRFYSPAIICNWKLPELRNSTDGVLANKFLFLVQSSNLELCSISY